MTIVLYHDSRGRARVREMAADPLDPDSFPNDSKFWAMLRHEAAVKFIDLFGKQEYYNWVDATFSDGAFDYNYRRHCEMIEAEIKRRLAVGANDPSACTQTTTEASAAA